MIAGLLVIAKEEGRGSSAAGMQPTKSGTIVESSVDAFDKDDFDPLRYINDMFPSGVHAPVDHFLVGVHSVIKQFVMTQRLMPGCWSNGNQFCTALVLFMDSSNCFLQSKAWQG